MNHIQVGGGEVVGNNSTSEALMISSSAHQRALERPTRLPPGWEGEAREERENDGLRMGLLVATNVGGRYIDEVNNLYVKIGLWGLWIDLIEFHISDQNGGKKDFVAHGPLATRGIHSHPRRLWMDMGYGRG
jgi:hypothetical protein